VSWEFGIISRLKSASPLLQTIVLLAIFTLAAYLRLAHLDANPKWYTDEGSNLIVAENLLHGRLEYMAIGQSTLVISRLPGFEGALAIWLRLFGDGIVSLRTFTGLLGAITVLVLFYCVQKTTGLTLLALLAALLLAVYPQAITYSRFGFTYNFLPPLVLIAVLGLWEYTQRHSRRWLLVSALAIGLGTLSDIWMIGMIAPFALTFFIVRPRDLVWALPTVLFPFCLYLMFQWIHAPGALATDLPFIFLRVSNRSLWTQIENIGQNYVILLSQDFWMPCGVIGFMVMRPARLGFLVGAVFFAMIAILGRTVALYGLSAYYMIPLLPLIVWGVATLLYVGVPYFWQVVGEVLPQLQARFSIGVRAVLCLAIVVIPFGVTFQLDLDHVNTGYPTAIDPFLIDPDAARQVAAYLNQHVSTTDRVIASPALAWLVRAQVSDLQMTIAYSGQGTVHFPASIPASRWLFDPRPQQARYVVLDNVWRTWGVVNIPGFQGLLDQIMRWPVAFQADTLIVYENPAWQAEF
jgi:hypothetical protein